MRFGVVVFPGTWSDCDFHYVISEVLKQPVKYVWHRDRNLADLDCVVLPGGFSYGDYLRARRHGGLLAGDGGAAASSRAAAGSCSASATASRSCARRACCPARCAQRASSSSASRRTCASRTPRRRSRAALRPGEVLTMPIKHGEGTIYADARDARALEAARPGRVPLLRRRTAASRGRPTRTARSRTSRASCNEDGQRRRADAASRARRGVARSAAPTGCCIFRSLLGSWARTAPFRQAVSRRRAAGP